VDATTNPTPPTLERLQSLNSDQITLDDLQEVFEITRAKATTTFDPKELLSYANDIGRLAILARRVTEYLRGKGIMTGSEPFKYFERLMNTEAQSIRDLSRRLTPSPAPVIPTPPPQTKPIIEIKTLVYPSDEQIADALNDGWQINHCATIVAQSGTTNKHAWMILLQREKPAEAVAPLPTSTSVGAPPVASAPATPPDDTQPIIIPAVPDKVAAIAAILQLADRDLPAAIVAGRAANIPLEAMTALYNRQTMQVGRASYERLQTERAATPPPRPLGFLTSNLLSTNTITEYGAA